MKRITAVICAAIMLWLSAGCSVDMSSGNGAPIPKDDSTSEWVTTESTVAIEITWDEAYPVLQEFTGVFGNIAGTALYKSDIAYMRTVSDYLSQYKSYESDLAIYMHSVELLCNTYYDLFARNIDREKAREQVGGYIDTYYGLSDQFRESVTLLDNTQLYSVLDMTDALAESLVASDSSK